jgi:hypothetical protein
LVDFTVKKFCKTAKMAVADVSDRNRWKKAGVLYGMRKSGLSQKPVYAILSGKPVRQQTLASFMRAADGLISEVVTSKLTASNYVSKAPMWIHIGAKWDLPPARSRRAYLTRS